jgi:UPF0755 protein
VSELFSGEQTAEAGDAEYEVDRPRRRMRRWVAVLLAVFVVGLLVLGAAGVWAYRQINPSGPPGEEVTFVVPQGASTQAIAQLLEDEGIVTDATVFRVYLRVRGGGPFQAGEYRMRPNSDMGDVVSALSAGPVIRYDRLTVPEGYRLVDIADRVGRVERLSAERFLEIARSGGVRSAFQPEGVATLEGLLFPETYQIDEREDEEAIVRRMVSTLDQVATELGYEQARERVGLTPYETLIVASLVEAEARVPEDRAKIARVIHNRIQQGMLLQIDATVIYAIGERREDGRVLFSDLEVDSPYNTYRNPGLPPTPIAVPGRAAMEAAINPAEGSWLFYVKYEEDGTHAFSDTLEEHNRRIREAKQRGVNP